MAEKLDSFDLKILAELQANGGASNQEIADELGVQKSSVKKYVTNSLRELGVDDRTQVEEKLRALYGDPALIRLPSSDEEETR